MQVLVNCKTKPVNYRTNYRMAFQARIKSKKTFLADYQQDPVTGDISIVKLDDGQVFPISATDIDSISFFLNAERPYIEFVRNTGTKILSFTIAPANDNLELGQEGVLALRDELDVIARNARVQVQEFIDPNPLKLCPDGVDDMEQLIALRRAEQLLESGNGGFASNSARMSQKDDYADIEFDRPQISPEYRESPMPDVPEMVDYSEMQQMLAETPEDYANIDFAKSVSEAVPDDFSQEHIYNEYTDASSSMVQEPALGDTQPMPAVQPGSFEDYENLDFDAVLAGVETVAAPARVFEPELVQEQEPVLTESEFEPEPELELEPEPELEPKPEPEPELELDDEPIEDAYDIDDPYADEPLTFDDLDEEEEGYDGYEESASLSEEKSDTLEAPEALAEIQNKMEQEKEHQLSILEGIIIEETPEEQPEVPDENYVDNLLSDLGKLDNAASRIDQELCDYDDVLARNRAEQTEFLAQINAMDVSSSEIVTGLIKMLQEQTDHNEALNATVKKEQILKRHCIEQLSAANEKVQQQAHMLDEVRRRLRFSQENQRRSEQFVADARVEVKKVVDDANTKISDALTRVDEMRQQVSEANALTEAANTDREKAIEAKLAAEKLRDEAMKFVDDEKERTGQIMDEFNKQLDSFTAKTLAKVKSQVARADLADQRYATATARITELESSLSEAKNRVFDLEAVTAQRDEVIGEKETELAALSKQIGSLKDGYATAIADKDLEHRNALQQADERWEQKLSEMRMLMEGKDDELTRLRERSETALNERDARIAELVNQRDEFRTLMIENSTESEKALSGKIQEYEEALQLKDAEIARLTSEKQVSEADYGDLMLEYNANQERLGNTGQMLSDLEQELVKSRARIAQLEDGISGLTQQDVDQAVDNALREQSEDMKAALEARDAVMIAGEKLLADIQGILAGASSGFSGRKKIREVEHLLEEYTAAYEAARAKSPTSVTAADFDAALEAMDAKGVQEPVPSAPAFDSENVVVKTEEYGFEAMPAPEMISGGWMPQRASSDDDSFEFVDVDNFDDLDLKTVDLSSFDEKSQ